MDCSGLPTWIVIKYHEDEKKNILGVKTRDIVSINDGDVCNATVTKQLLSQFSAPICVDIGGDVGWWSSFCLEHSPTANVFTFEPNPKSYKGLRERFRAEPRIEIFEKAVSEAAGIISLSFEGAQSNSRGENGSNAVPVETTTLDFLFEKHSRIHILKIDTEGHEAILFKGLLPHFPKIDSIIFEFSPYWYGTTDEECMITSFGLLKAIQNEYKYIYILSRRGTPNLDLLTTDQDLVDFVIFSHINHQQSDLLCLKQAFGTLPCV